MPRRKNPNGPYWTALRAAERKIIWDALILTGGDLKAAARLLDIHRNYIRKRINTLNIDLTLIRGGETAPPVEPITTNKPATSQSWLTST
jgi:hypothetical protein